MKSEGTQSETIWTERFPIHSWEVDLSRRASLPALCRLMQEAAWRHAEHLEFGYSHLAKRNLMWVLSRMLMEIHRYPAWGETIQIHTWPSGMDRLFAQRDFEILDERGDVIAAATGDWLILESMSRRPQRMEAIFGNRIRALPEKRALKERPSRIPPIQNLGAPNFFPVRFSDLDLQGHVSHAKYIEWILDSYPLTIHKRQRASLLEIHFLAESTLGDEVSVRSEGVEGGQPSYLHSLLRRRDEKEICRAKTTWEPQVA